MNSLPLLAALAWRNIWRQRARCAFNMIAISLAVVTMVLMGAFTRAMGGEVIEDYAHNLAGHAQIHHPDFLADPAVDHRYRLPAAARERLDRDPRVSVWGERIVVPAMIRSERQSLPVLLYGIDPPRERGLSFIADSLDDAVGDAQAGALVEGELMADADASGIVLGAELARLLHTGVGRRVVLSAHGAHGEVEEIGIRVRGLFRRSHGMDRGLAFIGLNRLGSMLKLDQELTEVVLKVADPMSIRTLQLEFEPLLPGLEFKRWDELNPLLRVTVEYKNLVLLIWIGLTFGVVAFGLVNTLLASFYERLHEFGLIQALGLRPAGLVLQILLEAAVLVGMATLFGLAVGLLCLYAMADGVSLGAFAAGAELVGMSTELRPVADVGEMLLIAVAVLVLGLVASLYPAIHASRHLPRDILTRI